MFVVAGVGVLLLVLLLPLHCLYAANHLLTGSWAWQAVGMEPFRHLITGTCLPCIVR